MRRISFWTINRLGRPTSEAGLQASSSWIEPVAAAGPGSSPDDGAMSTSAVVRHRLVQSWPILTILLLVTVLATLVSDRLTINALLDDGIARGIDANGILIGLQRGVILLAMGLALLGQQAVLNRLFVVAIGVTTLALITSVAALVATFSHQPAIGAFRLLTDGALLWTMNLLVFAAWYWLVDSGAAPGTRRPPGAR